MKIEKFILEEIKNVKGESIKATANIKHGNDGFYFTLDTKTIQTILTFAHDENLGRLKSLAWGEIRKMIEDGDVESINDYIARIVSVIVNESSAYNINARFDNEFNSYKTYEIIELFYKFVEFTSKKFNCSIQVHGENDKGNSIKIRQTFDTKYILEYDNKEYGFKTLNDLKKELSKNLE